MPTKVVRASEHILLKTEDSNLGQLNSVVVNKLQDGRTFIGVNRPNSLNQSSLIESSQFTVGPKYISVKKDSVFD